MEMEMRGMGWYGMVEARGYSSNYDGGGDGDEDGDGEGFCFVGAFEGFVEYRGRGEERRGE